MGTQFKSMRCLLAFGVAWSAASADMVWSTTQHKADAYSATPSGIYWGNEVSDGYAYGKVENIYDVAQATRKLTLLVRTKPNSTKSDYAGASLKWNSASDADISAQGGVCLTYRATRPFRLDMVPKSKPTSDYLGITLDPSTTFTTVYKSFDQLEQEGWGSAYTPDWTHQEGVSIRYKSKHYTQKADSTNVIEIVQLGLGDVCDASNNPSEGKVKPLPADYFWNTATTLPANNQNVWGGTWETYASAGGSITPRNLAKDSVVGFKATLASPTNTNGYPTAGISMYWLPKTSGVADTVDLQNLPGLCIAYKSDKALRVQLQQAGIDGNNDLYGYSLPAQSTFTVIDIPISALSQEKWGYETLLDKERQLALRFEYKDNKASSVDAEILQVGLTGECTVPAFPVVQIKANTDTSITEDDTLRIALSKVFKDRDIKLNHSIYSSSNNELLPAKIRNDTLIVEPDSNANGTGKIVVKATPTDDNVPGDFGLFQLAITVTNVEHPPVATPDTYVTNEDTALVVPVKGFLVNDYDRDDPRFGCYIIIQPKKGTLSTPTFCNGSFTYTPNPDANGTDQFTYELLDLTGNKTTATVTITIKPVNDKPKASGTIPLQGPLVEDFGAAIFKIPKSSVTFTDPDAGDILTPAVVTDGNVLASLGSSEGSDYVINLLSVENFNGLATVKLYVRDKALDTAGVSFQIQIDPADDKPTAVADAYTIAEDSVLVADVLANDLNPDKADLLVSVATAPNHGTAQANANGTITYTPNADWNGKDTLWYSLGYQFNGTAKDTTVRVIFTVNAANDSPRLAANAAITDTTVTEDFTPALVIPTTDLFTDIDKDPLTLSVKTSNGKVRASVSKEGVLTIANSKDSTVSTTITLSASDGIKGSTPATLSFQVHVTPVNDEPRIIGAIGARTIQQGTVLRIPLDSVFHDPESEKLEYSASAIDFLDLTFSGDTLIISLKSAAESGKHILTITATDTNGASNRTSFSLNIDASTAVLVMPHDRQNWESRLLRGNGNYSLTDIDGRTLVSGSLPTQPQDIHKVMQNTQRAVILRIGDESWLINPSKF